MGINTALLQWIWRIRCTNPVWLPQLVWLLQLKCMHALSIHCTWLVSTFLWLQKDKGQSSKEGACTLHGHSAADFQPHSPSGASQELHSFMVCLAIERCVIHLDENVTLTLHEWEKKEISHGVKLNKKKKKRRKKKLCLFPCYSQTRACPQVQVVRWGRLSYQWRSRSQKHPANNDDDDDSDLVSYLA